MIILQPLKQYCDFFFKHLVSMVPINGNEWYTSLYTETYKDKKSNQQKQKWYEQAYFFPNKDECTTFCVELNYEPEFGLRLAYGIRKKHQTKRVDSNLVTAFKNTFNSYYKKEEYKNYNECEQLNYYHWVVWCILDQFKINIDTNNETYNDLNLDINITEKMKNDLSNLAKDINDFMQKV